MAPKILATVAGSHRAWSQITKNAIEVRKVPLGPYITSLQAMLQTEETSSSENFVFDHKLATLIWLFTTILPKNCKTSQVGHKTDYALRTHTFIKYYTHKLPRVCKSTGSSFHLTMAPADVESRYYFSRGQL